LKFFRKVGINDTQIVQISSVSLNRCAHVGCSLLFCVFRLRLADIIQTQKLIGLFGGNQFGSRSILAASKKKNAHFVLAKYVFFGLGLRDRADASTLRDSITNIQKRLDARYRLRLSSSRRYLHFV
jgi:hypothetical protein